MLSAGSLAPSGRVLPSGSFGADGHLHGHRLLCEEAPGRFVQARCNCRNVPARTGYQPPCYDVYIHNCTPNCMHFLLHGGMQLRMMSAVDILPELGARLPLSYQRAALLGIPVIDRSRPPVRCVAQISTSRSRSNFRRALMIALCSVLMRFLASG